MAGASALEGSVPVPQPQWQVLALSEPQGLGPQPLCRREVAICRRRPSVEGVSFKETVQQEVSVLVELVLQSLPRAK